MSRCPVNYHPPLILDQLISQIISIALFYAIRLISATLCLLFCIIYELRTRLFLSSLKSLLLNRLCSYVVQLYCVCTKLLEQLKQWNARNRLISCRPFWKRQFLNRFMYSICFFELKSNDLSAVVLKLVGSIEPNRCHASIHRTLNYNQERIQKILEGDAVLN